VKDFVINPAPRGISIYIDDYIDSQRSWKGTGLNGGVGDGKKRGERKAD
jgi:hypothetical protein